MTSLLAVLGAVGETGKAEPTTASGWENITLSFFADASPKPAASGPATIGMYGIFVNPKSGDVYLN